MAQTPLPIPLALQLIRTYEGFSSCPYICPAGVYTIGYGHTENVHAQSACITLKQANFLLLQDCAALSTALDKILPNTLNNNQYQALLSFAFNCGVEALGRSTLLKKIKARDYMGAADEFPRWVHAKGVRLPGLVKRRAEERLLFLKPLE